VGNIFDFDHRIFRHSVSWVQGLYDPDFLLPNSVGRYRRHIKTSMGNVLYKLYCCSIYIIRFISKKSYPLPPPAGSSPCRLTVHKAHTAYLGEHNIVGHRHGRKTLRRQPFAGHRLDERGGDSGRLDKVAVRVTHL